MITDSIPINNFLKTQHEALGFAAAGFTAQKAFFFPLRKPVLAFPALKEALGLTSPKESVQIIRESFHDSAVTQTSSPLFHFKELGHYIYFH